MTLKWLVIVRWSKYGRLRQSAESLKRIGTDGHRLTAHALCNKSKETKMIDENDRYDFQGFLEDAALDIQAAVMADYKSSTYSAEVSEATERMRAILERMRMRIDNQPTH
jgi:hypothetical protein